MNRKYVWYVLCAIILFLFDRVTKLCAYQFLGSYNVTTWLSFNLVLNRGISWGLFNQSDQVLFVLITMIVCVITLGIAIHAYIQYKKGCALWGSLLLIVGSLSNIIDRFWYGGVIDFIQLHYKQYAWPLFNIADICIVLGVAILFIEQIRE